MSDALLVSTRKGLFILERGNGAWQVARNSFLGDNVALAMVDPRDGSWYAALDLGHFGAKLWRSRDDGATWQKVAFPYAGSLFGVLAWEDDHILAFGLRGNVYESTDLGSTWTKVDSAIGSNLMGGTALANGGAALVGSNGAVLVRPDGASPFVLGTYTNAAGETPALAAVIPADAAGYVVVGEKGVDTYQPKK